MTSPKYGMSGTYERIVASLLQISLAAGFQAVCYYGTILIALPSDCGPPELPCRINVCRPVMLHGLKHSPSGEPTVDNTANHHR